jgi:SSS family solute:Na+ symporter
MAIAAGVKTNPAFADGFKTYGNNFAVPALFLQMFPSWFAGVAFAAVAIGALVPAAIMSIATANLFTRNIYREYCAPDCSQAHECQVAKIASLLVKVGALVFIVALPPTYAIQLQLLGGIWIIQTLPAVVIGLYTRWLHPWALLAGWAAGIVSGTAMAASLNFAKSIYAVTIFGVTIPCYAALSSLILNLAVSIALSAAFNALSQSREDATLAADYL